jgi:hypothetical protein
MKKQLTITFIILSALLILDSANAGHALFMFYLAGEVPGTNVILSANTMMQIFALLIGFVVARIGNFLVMTITHYLSTRNVKPATRTLRRRLIV